MNIRDQQITAESSSSGEDESVMLKDRPKFVMKDWAKVRPMKMVIQFEDDKDVWIEPGDYRCVQVAAYNPSWDTGERCLDGDLDKFMKIHAGYQCAAIPIKIPCPFVRMALPGEDLTDGDSFFRSKDGSTISERESMWEQWGLIDSRKTVVIQALSTLGNSGKLYILVTNTSKTLTFQLSLMADTLFTAVVTNELNESNSFPYNSRFLSGYLLDMQDWEMESRTREHWEEFEERMREERDKERLENEGMSPTRPRKFHADQDARSVAGTMNEMMEL